MPSEHIFSLLAKSPSPAKKKSMRSYLLKRIDGRILTRPAASLHSSTEHLRTVVLSRIAHPTLRNTLQQTRVFLSPSPSILDRLRTEILSRIGHWEPIAEHWWTTRWTRPLAICAVFALVIRLTPALFIATPLQAESQHLLIPTQGFVAVMDGAEWGPVHQQIVLEHPLTIRTAADSSATIVLRDDAVLRLGENTEVNLRKAAFDPSLGRSVARVIYGNVWLTSLLPETLNRETVLTIPQGTVAIRQGSVNVLADPQQSTVQVFHRSADVLATGMPGSVHLLQGDQLALLPESQTQRHMITDSLRNTEWVQTNLARDAVHRTEIATRRQQLAESVAGILPTSAFYSIKRASEAVDLWLTLSGDVRTQKKLQFAQTRLNEAVALLNAGESDAAQSPLAEYRHIIDEIANLTEEDVRSLLTASLINSAATVASALPHSQLYDAKKTVMEASASLETSEILPSQIDLYLLSDALLEIESRIAEGKFEEAAIAIDGISGAVASVLNRQEFGELKVQKEDLKVIKTIVRSIAASIEQARELANAEQDILLHNLNMGVTSLLPPVPQVAVSTEKPAVCMTVREVTRRTNQFLSSVFTYQTPRAQRNEVLRQISSLPDCPQSARILAKVMNKVPVYTRSFVWEALQELDSTL